MKIKITILTGTLACLLYPIHHFAAQLAPDKQVNYHADKLSINTALGYLGGEANEYVYDEDTHWKVSQLNWKIKRAAIIKGEINYDVLTWLTANASGWTTLTTGQASMDDYDWLNPNQINWTDWSHHENTDLRYANDIDFNLRGWVLQNNHLKLGMTTGYKRTSFSFLAKGGCFQYSNGTFIGCFPYNEPGLGYQQKFNTVYLGLAGNYSINNLEFNAVLKFSPWVWATDVDQHYLRNLTFKEHGDNSNFYSAGIMAGYYITHHTKIFAEATYNRFTNGKADTEIVDNRDGTYTYLNNTAGLGNKNYSLAIGIQYRT
ncbi:omptin family outer membrane protease [Legionella oakridgensis]|uniref:omptin family outer membrane protease n=1 Tax=Legionella oakridgensis TaxID=29423 RepID=UPI0003DE5E73|nr:omptin family outer membrane protease [Legionella oakridgensis]ETO93396.1 outer membrane protease [Legionella oakridgensis RV-2-2007]